MKSTWQDKHNDENISLRCLTDQNIGYDGDVSDASVSRRHYVVIALKAPQQDTGRKEKTSKARHEYIYICIKKRETRLHNETVYSGQKE